MTGWSAYLLVAVGGALGSAARYGLARLLEGTGGGGFPWPILIVNLIGSTAMGAVVVVAGAALPLGQGGRLLLAVGVLGGFTTFSAFALDLAELLDRGAIASAFVYAAMSVGAALGGLLLARWALRALVGASP